MRRRIKRGKLYFIAVHNENKESSDETIRLLCGPF